MGARVVSILGDGRVGTAVVETPQGVRRIETDVVALGHGFIPSTEIARQLGCHHVYIDKHIGYLATETEPDGRTNSCQRLRLGRWRDSRRGCRGAGTGRAVWTPVLRDLARPGALAPRRQACAPAARPGRSLPGSPVEAFPCAAVRDR